ncbi:RICIN domain-containing protein [Micromonospora sp. AMSO12t]|uniref:RICIN domain-containing protein n=1 Tax=Micromonospora sp. AMSO12t TaxID=2650410 RepID=UPI001788E0B3|nr:RICIN domain-containing protein [Micromonospora sp. AMSO12t]
MHEFRRRCAAALVAVMAVTGGVLGPVGVANAAVPAPDPVAIGQASTGDTHVLATDSDTAGAQVKIRTYQSGLPAAVKSQRWKFEVVTPGTVPVYRIRHLSSNRCLQSSAAADGANVVLADCATTNPQLWTNGTAQTFPFRGFNLRSKRDGRCLDLYYSDDGQPATMWTCSSTYDTQLWRARVGGFDCSERTVVGLCVKPAQPVFGVMGAWRQQPMSLAEPGSYDPDANTMSNFVTWDPLSSSGSNPGYDYAELGWRGKWASDGNTTVHGAYWLEGGIENDEIVEELYAINESDSTLADGSTHTWMSLGNSNGQWDMFYDFNPVGTTRLAAGNRTRDLEYGLLPQYAENIALATGFENRLQILDGNSVWRRPRLGEVAQFQANICGQPDPYAIEYGETNTPPYCFTTSLVPRASATAGDPAEVDRFVMGKPAVGTLASGPNVAADRSGPASVGTHNGVDQRRLAACMATDAARCLATVPGLAECVQARKVCNTTRRATEVRGVPLSADKARQIAQQTVMDDSAGIATTSMSIAQLLDRSKASLRGVDPSEQVHVVTGTGTVKSLSGRPDREFRGYAMVYQARTGRLLYACLGQTCALKETP